jgi:hypothetical protein
MGSAHAQFAFADPRDELAWRVARHHVQPCLNDCPPAEVDGLGIRYQTGRSTMNQLISVAIGGLALVAASTAHGQDLRPLSPDGGYVFGAGPEPVPDEPRTSPLFTLGGLDFRVWAPVEPDYSIESNRDPAGEPLWGLDEFRRPIAFRTTRPAGVARPSMAGQPAVAISWERRS